MREASFRPPATITAGPGRWGGYRVSGLEGAIAHYHALLEADAGLAGTCAEMPAERPPPACPAGTGCEDGLRRFCLDLAVRREFGRASRVSPLYARHRLVEALLDAYRQFRRAYPEAGAGSWGLGAGARQGLSLPNSQPPTP